MKKRVVIYARFSSYGQTEQSIEGQLRECYDFARRNEYAVIGEYIDRAMTGTNDKRPSFLKMIDDSKRLILFSCISSTDLRETDTTARIIKRS